MGERLGESDKAMTTAAAEKSQDHGKSGFSSDSTGTIQDDNDADEVQIQNHVEKVYVLYYFLTIYILFPDDACLSVCDISVLYLQL